METITVKTPGEGKIGNFQSDAQQAFRMNFNLQNGPRFQKSEAINPPPAPTGCRNRLVRERQTYGTEKNNEGKILQEGVAKQSP